MALIPVAEALAEFLDHLEHGRRMSRHSLRAYDQDVRAFLDHLGEGRGGEPPDELDFDSLDRRVWRGFVLDLNQRGLARTTISRRLAGLRAFLKFLRRRGDMSTDPGGELIAPKRARHLPKALTVDQVFALLDEPGPDDPYPRRDRAIIEVLYAAGLRISELSGLDLAHIEVAGDIRNGATLKIRGKGDKERLAPIGVGTLGTLRAWLDSERVALDKGRTPAVFLNKNNDFHAFHARQGCGAALLQLATAIVLIVAGVIGGLAWGKLQHLMSILLYVVMIGFVGLNAYGMYLASKYEYEALPVVGPIFVKFLTFLHKAKG